MTDIHIPHPFELIAPVDAAEILRGIKDPLLKTDIYVGVFAPSACWTIKTHNGFIGLYRINAGDIRLAWQRVGDVPKRELNDIHNMTVLELFTGEIDGRRNEQQALKKQEGDQS